MTRVDIIVLAFILGFLFRPYFDISLLILKNAIKNTKNLEDD